MDAMTVDTAGTGDTGGGDSVGGRLKATREEKNLSLDEVARATKIRKEFLLAIEEDRLDALPGSVFARGFVRTYADFLGVDGQTLSHKAAKALDGQVSLEPPGAPKAKRGFSGWALVGTAIALGVAAAGALLTHWHW